MNRLLVTLFTLLFTLSLQAQTLYVKADANGANNGTSWTNAYTDLQNAIATANYGTQIWVAIGTYKPTQGTSRDTYFELKNGVEIYGGFIGTEMQLSERDYIQNESILSGDIGVVGDSLDNSYTIVYSLGTDENTILEGFTIRDGNADYEGGDVPTTHPSNSGAGVYLFGENSDLRCQIKHCRFENNNSVYRGGGLFVSTGDNQGITRPIIFANSFIKNSAGTLGGGYYWIGGTYLQAELIIGDSLIFYRNTANIGGGMHATSRLNDAETKIRNCSFTENSSNSFGGALYFREGSFENIGLRVEGCNFEYNNSVNLGSGIFYETDYEFTNLTIKDSYFDHNGAASAVEVNGYVDVPSSSRHITVENTTMSWNAGQYGGALNIGVEGEILIEVKSSTFQYNSAVFSGGAIYSPKLDHILRVSNSYFEGNAATNATGGGIHVQTNDVEITNSIFKGNIGKTGAGIRMINGSVTNCVFYENNAVQQGGGIRCQQPTIANCIFWNNINFGLGPDIFNNSFPITLESCLFSAADCSEINYNNSNINCGANSLFNINPQFVNPTIGDFTTAANSIVRDAGDSSFYPSNITEDYFGNPRIEGNNIDLGVYEIPAVSISSVMSSVGDCQEESINNGGLDYEITNGVTPLTLAIGDIEETTENISGTLTGLAGGTYDFTVTDAVGNSSAQSVFIPTLPQPTTSTEVTTPTCNSFTNGVISLSVTGETGPFSVLWSNGTDDFGQFGLGGGEYTYTIMDAFGCQSTGLQILEEPEAIELNATTQNTLCADSSTGQISINPTGGTGFISASWSPNPNNETDYELTDIPAGTYSVTVTDESQCALAEQHVIANGNSIEISGQVTNAGCNGSASGAIAVTPITGTGNFEYIWSNGMSGATISGLVVEEYTVTATDGNGCSVIESYTVFAGAPITFFPTITSVSCSGSENGIINLNVEDTSELDFTWSSNVNGQTGTAITNLAAGIYFLTITDGDDCPSYAEYTISEPSEISINSTQTSPSCLGVSDGTISIFAEGGTTLEPNDYVYQITPNLTQVANGSFSGAIAGQYQILVTDVNGCTAESTIILAEGDATTINGIANDALCFGQNTGFIDLSGDGNDGSIYNWSSNANGQITNLITELTADTYTVTVTDAMGCQGSNEFVIAEPTEINLTSSTENVSCVAGDDGVINVSADGGTPTADCGYTYNISPELNSIDCGIFTDATANIYTIIATDANGCQANTVVEVIENEAITVAISTTNASCPGATDGFVDVEIDGGEAPYTIEGETENLSVGEYTITIIDVNNCQSTSTFIIEESAGLNLDIEVTNVSCSGGNNGAAEVTITGGIPPYTIEGETTNLSAGEYMITVSDMNSCGATATFMVSQPDPLNFDFDIINATTSSSMDGSILLENITGGTAPYDFVWANGEETEDLFNIAAGIYNLSIVDDNGCSYNFGFDVDFNTAVNNLSALGWEIRLLPNILLKENKTQLFLESDRIAKGKLQVYNSVGQLSMDVKMTIEAGVQQFDLSTEGFSAGVYFVRVEIENFGVEILRLVVVE